MNRIILVAGFVVAACSTPVDSVVPPPGDPCTGVSCSERGQCASLRGAALCVCDAGSFAEGLECKPIVAGAECEGVTCNGRGVCVVLSGMPNTPRCDCNADSVSAGATTCVAKPEPCAGITCSGHGTCAVAGTMPVCVCEAGFRTAPGNTCEAVVVGQECQGVDCGGHGTCAVAGGAPLCSCDVGYDRLGTTCVPRAVSDAGGSGPCEGITCSGRGQCAVLGAATPVCVCNSGYVASSLACVLQGTVGGDLTLLAGALGGPGNVDGNSNTRFDSPTGVAHDATGNVFVGGQSIRKITPSGSVSTLAGLAGLGNAGSIDGAGSVARFNDARFPVVDSAGSILVYDQDASGLSGSIRKIAPSGIVSTLSRGLLSVVGMTIDMNDNLWANGFCAGGNNDPCLKKITPSGVVTSVLHVSAPSTARPFPGPVTMNADGSKVFTVDSDVGVWSIDTVSGALTAVTSTSGLAPAPGLGIRAICRDASNNLWLASSFWGRIYRVPSTGGTATLIAGDASAVFTTAPVHSDGPGLNARFYGPIGLSCDQAAGKVYVADTGNHTIRSVAMGGNNAVTTIAGTPFALGAVDGTGGAARFRFPQQVVADSAGNWFVADSANAVIRKVTPAGVVSVFAGSFGMVGLTDGTGTAARFRGTDCAASFGCRVIGLAIDSSDNLYVADRGRRLTTGPNRSIREPDAVRKITPAGVVTTLASGSTVTPASPFTLYDQFDSIAVDTTNGDVYFNASDGVRRFRGGTISLVVPKPSQSGSFAIDGYFSVAVDGSRRKLFIAERQFGGGARVSRYDLSGAMPLLESTLTGQSAPALSAPGLGRVSQLAVAPNGALAAAFPDSGVILRIDPTFTRVDKIAGEYSVQGVELGPLPARLTTPTGVAFNSAGQFGVVMGRTSSGFGEGALLVTTGFTP